MPPLEIISERISIGQSWLSSCISGELSIRALYLSRTLWGGALVAEATPHRHFLELETFSSYSRAPDGGMPC